MAVFVLDRRKEPLMPCSEKRARKLLEAGRARVHKLSPFTIRLIDRRVEQSVLQPVALATDPGSKATGFAVAREEGGSGEGCLRHVLALFELRHRGHAISEASVARRGHRRRRRGQNLRYRASRSDNRTRPDGWLAPSLRHRLETALSWVSRLRRLAPVTRLVVERVRFDTQAMQNPEIAGVEYQRGALAGYELREYLLEKWSRRCAYCDAADVPLQVEHVRARARGGSDRASNLALACAPCNGAKGALPLEEFLVGQPQRLRRILAHAKAPLRDAAAMNATRWALWRSLATTGLPVEASTGGRTKWNRSRFGVPKSHALDSACTGEVSGVLGWRKPTLVLAATGRGRYQRALLDRYGFPRGHSTRTRRVHGFATGDLVRATVPSGKKAGTHEGRVAVRATGSFNVRTATGLVQGISHRHCVLLARGDGYGRGWAQVPQPMLGAPPHREQRGFLAGELR